MEGDLEIPLFKNEINEKIEVLKEEFLGNNFTKNKIHSYYTNVSQFKHNVDIKTVKDTLPKFEKIIGAFKRPASEEGKYKYSFIYEIEKNKSLYLCFYLDETPPKFFNAYTFQEYKIKKKIQKWLKRKFFNKE